MKQAQRDAPTDRSEKLPAKQDQQPRKPASQQGTTESQPVRTRIGPEVACTVPRVWTRPDPTLAIDQRVSISKIAALAQS